MSSPIASEIATPSGSSCCVEAHSLQPRGESFSPLAFVSPVRPRRCGIVLAAGDGVRLQPLVRRLHGKPLPKQYVSFVGTRSMLEHTHSRAERLIPPGRLFTVVARDHLRHPEARTQLKSRPKGRVVVQPHNRDTLPGLLLPLLRLRRYYPDSLVAVFPSDHWILEEDRFMDCVRTGFEEVERRPEEIILIGIEPTEPEPEYGYIVPEAGTGSTPFCPTRRVRRFVEKPDPDAARELMHAGALWNTMVLVFHTAAFLALLEKSLPSLLADFLGIEEALGRPDESSAIEESYREMMPLNLSRDFFEALAGLEPSRLTVLPARGVTWSDWGSEKRIFGAAHPVAAWRQGDRHARESQVESDQQSVLHAASASG